MIYASNTIGTSVRGSCGNANAFATPTGEPTFTRGYLAVDDLRERIAKALYDGVYGTSTSAVMAAIMSVVEPELAAIRQSTLEEVREKAAAIVRNDVGGRELAAYEIEKLELGE